MGIKYIEHKNGTSTPDKVAVEYAVKDSAGNVIKDTYYLATNPSGYTTNTGTVIGSSLTADNFVLGNGTVNVKASALKPVTSSTTWSASSDVYVPTMKAISSYVTGLGYTTNTGTVTSVQVQASEPLQSSTSTAQSSSLSTTISFKNQNANVVLAGPSSGSTAAAPTFRSLVVADIPTLTSAKISDFDGAVDTALGINTSSGDTTKFLNAKGGWTVPYTHPTYTSATAAAVKIGRDATGHVVIGSAITYSDVGAAAASHSHYWADVQTATSASTETTPTFADVTAINYKFRPSGSTTVKATMTYNITYDTIDFVFV